MRSCSMHIQTEYLAPITHQTYNQQYMSKPVGKSLFGPYGPAFTHYMWRSL